LGVAGRLTGLPTVFLLVSIGRTAVLQPVLIPGGIWSQSVVETNTEVVCAVVEVPGVTTTCSAFCG
jgi:hypothetical protein